MTPDEVRERVAAIDAASGDDETAHWLEDDLRGDVLHAIATGVCTSPAECAREALTTSEIDFSRWYA